MIEVIVNILPQGNPNLRRELGKMTIANISDLADLSDYRYMVSTEASQLTGEPKQLAEGKILRHNRLWNIWSLVSKVLYKEGF